MRRPRGGAGRRPAAVSEKLRERFRVKRKRSSVPIEKFVRLAENPNTSWPAPGSSPGVTRPSTGPAPLDAGNKSGHDEVRERLGLRDRAPARPNANELQEHDAGEAGTQPFLGDAISRTIPRKRPNGDKSSEERRDTIPVRWRYVPNATGRGLSGCPGRRFRKVSDSQER